MLTVIILSVTMLNVLHIAKPSAVMLNVDIVIMLSVIILSVIMLTIIILSIIMLNVVLQ
jgi:hypothetical protein